MKSLFITIFMLIFSASAFAEYVKIALPKSSEIEGDNAKFYAKGALAVDMANESEVRRVGEFVDALMSAGSEEFAAMLKKPELASKSAKFLKLARLGKGANLFAFKFGKLTIAVFEIPSGSRMRAGMNFFALENVGSGESSGLRWNVSFNNPMVVLAAQCAFTNPQKLDFSGLVAKSEKDGVLLEKACGADMPFFVFGNDVFAGVSADPNVDAHPAAEFYRKIQDVFFSWKIDEYAEFMSAPSKRVFLAQYAGMTDTQKKKVLSDYFSWHKQYLRVLQLGEREFIVLFKRYRDGSKEQFDVAYITLDGSANGGVLENFGKRTLLKTAMTPLLRIF